MSVLLENLLTESSDIFIIQYAVVFPLHTMLPFSQFHHQYDIEITFVITFWSLYFCMTAVYHLTVRSSNTLHLLTVIVRHIHWNLEDDNTLYNRYIWIIYK